MRLLLLCLFTIAATAADNRSPVEEIQPEKITMRDGRVLIGIHIPGQKTMRVMAGNLSASVPIDPRDIAHREPAPIPVQTPAAKSDNDESVIAARPVASPVDSIISAKSAYAAELTRISELHREAERNYFNAVMDATKHLKLIKTSESADPTRSEMERNKRINLYNENIESLNRARERGYRPIDSNQDFFYTIQENRSFMKLLAEFAENK